MRIATIEDLENACISGPQAGAFADELAAGEVPEQQDKGFAQVVAVGVLSGHAVLVDLNRGPTEGVVHASADDLVHELNQLGPLVGIWTHEGPLAIERNAQASSFTLDAPAGLDWPGPAA